MSKVKTTVDEGAVKGFLQKYFNQEIHNFIFIKGGESSQAFSFTVSEGDFVIRLNREQWAFEKDKYSFEHFHTEEIPIPEITDIGVFNEQLKFAISRKAPGIMLIEISDDEYHDLLPNIMRTLDAIHAIDVSHTKGFGKWEVDGTAETESWKEYILSVKKFVYAENSPTMFETTFLEKEVWDAGYERLITLLPFCPEDRYLMHGDYGSDNVMTENGKITGVLDWAGAKYGDFLYDIAWLSFWNPEKNSVEFFENYYQDKGIQHFSERIACYQLFIALGSLSFYAYSDQREKYERSKEKLATLMK